MRKKAFRYAIQQTLPVFAGYLFLGIAFGLIMTDNGYPFYYPIAMSLIIYSGALQFAAVPLLLQGFIPIQAFLLGLLISIRHLFYGLAMLDRFKDTGRYKWILAPLLTDETFSILSSVDVPKDMDQNTFYLSVSLLDYAYWNLGTLMGILAGNMIPFDLSGMDFALTALFIVLFIEQLKNKEGKIAGMIGFAVTLLVLLSIGNEYLVPISMIVIVMLLLCLKKGLNNE